MTNPEHWQNNILEKVAEIRRQVFLFISGRDQKDALKAVQLVEGALNMFSQSRRPTELNAMRSSLTQVLDQVPNRPVHFEALIKALDGLEALAGQSDREEMDFNAIFDRYKLDKKLLSLTESLLELLKRLLSEGGDVLSAALYQELQTIVRELEQSRKYGLPQQQLATELAIRILGPVLEKTSGNEGFAYVEEARNVAWEVRERISQLAYEAKMEIAQRLQLTLGQRSLVSEPHIARSLTSLAIESRVAPGSPDVTQIPTS